MSPEPDSGRTTVPLAPVMAVDDAPHPGCNCGRRRKARRRHALADRRPRHRLPRPRPRAGAAGSDRRPRLGDARVGAARPLRRHHPVWRGRDRGTRRAASRPSSRGASTACFSSATIPEPLAARPRPRSIGCRGRTRNPTRRPGLEVLASLRQSHAIEAAALFVPASFDPATATEMRASLGLADHRARSAPDSLAAAADVLIGSTREIPMAHDRPNRRLRRGHDLARALGRLSTGRVRASWPRASVIVVT